MPDGNPTQGLWKKSRKWELDKFGYLSFRDRWEIMVTKTLVMGTIVELSNEKTSVKISLLCTFNTSANNETFPQLKMGNILVRRRKFFLQSNQEQRGKFLWEKKNIHQSTQFPNHKNMQWVQLHNGGFCNSCITKRIVNFPIWKAHIKGTVQRDRSGRN